MSFLSLDMRDPAASPPQSLHLACWGALVYVLAFTLHYLYIINAFYHYGAPYMDSGLFAHLLWHNDWVLTNPYPRGSFSYFAVHFSPLLLIPNAFSYLFESAMVEFYASFMALLYASLGLSLFYAFSRFLNPTRYAQMALLSFLSLAFAFNGSVMMGMWMPHFEYAIPMGILLFLFHLGMGNRRLALISFIFTVLVREDAGFHLVAVLGLLTALRFCQKKPIRTELKYITAALTYSILAFTLNRLIMAEYDVQGHVFKLIYSGDAFYAHLSWELVWERLTKIANQQSHLWLGFIITMLWALWRRDIYLTIGFLSALPWFLVNITAFNPNTGTLYAYYSFPFVIAFGWPLLAALWRHGPHLPKWSLRDALILQLLLSLTWMIRLYDGHLVIHPIAPDRLNRYLPQSSTAHKDNLLKFIDLIHSGDKSLGVIVVTHQFASLSIGREEMEDVLLDGTQRPINSLIAMMTVPVSDKMVQYSLKNDLKYFYCVNESTTCILSNRDPELLGDFTPLLTRRQFPPRLVAAQQKARDEADKKD